MSDIKELEAGRVIGSYRVVRCIGQGGMGTVYEVEHVELGVHYALKTFTFDPADEVGGTLKTKFLEEGKVLARLKHANIAHVFDLAFDEATQMPYFVMDLVTYEDGESYTAEDVNLEDIDEELAFKWFKQVAAALDYIHAEGIVHRDIKPANLLVDKDLNVIITDFGISKIFGRKMQTDVEAAQTMVTKTGRGKLVMGTEKYMAPEVEAGDEAVPESDAYALGVMALRWLTGFFYKDNPGAISLLSGKKYRWLSVLPRLLAPTPNRRPATYSDLVKQLKPLAKAAPDKKPVPGKVKRSYAHAIVTAVFVLAAAGGASWFGYQAWQRYEADKKAQAEKFAKLEQKLKEDAKARAESEAAAKEAEAKQKAEAQRADEERQKLLAAAGSQKEFERDTGKKDGAIAKNFRLIDAFYGVFEKGRPKDGLSIDYTEVLKGYIDKGIYSLKIDNKLVGDDPANGHHKYTQIRYVWRGSPGSVVLHEGQLFEVTNDGVVESKARLKDEMPGVSLVFGKDSTKVVEEELGKIPDRQYKWLNGDDPDSPNFVNFQLANGDHFEFVPMKRGNFFMSNERGSGKHCHKVTFTRPFWFSRICLTVNQWRDFGPNDYDECRAIEKALGGFKPVVLGLLRKQIDDYCAYLTKRYANCKHGESPRLKFFLVTSGLI